MEIIEIYWIQRNGHINYFFEYKDYHWNMKNSCISGNGKCYVLKVTIENDIKYFKLNEIDMLNRCF